MKHLSLFIASSAIALALAAPASAQMGPAGTSATPPSGTTNASLTGGQKMPVANMPNAQQIAGAPVMDSSGKQIGRVIGVKTASGGKADLVKVGFTTGEGMGRAAFVKAEKLTLDPAKQVVVADLTPSEVSQLEATAGPVGASPAAGTGSTTPPASGGASGGGKGY